jgi:hypothetical protein
LRCRGLTFAEVGCAHGARVNGRRRSVRRDRLWNLARAATLLWQDENLTLLWQDENLTLLWQDENLIPSPEETPHGETSVPTSVRVVAVPQVLVEIYPEYRGHMYFVVGDEIIIVDRDHRIIAVIAV